MSLSAVDSISNVLIGAFRKQIGHLKTSGPRYLGTLELSLNEILIVESRGRLSFIVSGFRQRNPGSIERFETTTSLNHKIWFGWETSTGTRKDRLVIMTSVILCLLPSSVAAVSLGNKHNVNDVSPIT